MYNVDNFTIYSNVKLLIGFSTHISIVAYPAEISPNVVLVGTCCWSGFLHVCTYDLLRVGGSDQVRSVAELSGVTVVIPCSRKRWRLLVIFASCTSEDDRLLQIFKIYLYTLIANNPGVLVSRISAHIQF